VRQRVGLGFRNLLIASLPAGAPYFDDALALLNTTYQSYYMRKTAPYDGVASLLAALQAAGVKLGCNSNKWTDYSKALLAKHFGNIRWVDIIGERVGKPKKPDPTGALEIALKMGLPPASVLFAGDSKTDIETGRAGGFATAGLLWGFRTREELVDAGAGALAATPAALGAYLLAGAPLPTR
jgi:phosphoglycolate phosphatase